MRILSATAVLCFVSLSWATEVREFRDDAERVRYEALLSELRCLVCQNQSLADSDADLARDLRDEVYNMIRQGRSASEAAQFLTDRYGDFVLYKPPIKPVTYLLWGAPLVFVGAGLLVWFTQRRRASSEPADFSEQEHALLADLKRQSDDISES